MPIWTLLLTMFDIKTKPPNGRPIGLSAHTDIAPGTPLIEIATKIISITNTSATTGQAMLLITRKFIEGTFNEGTY